MAACESLPSFDPTFTIKHRLFGSKQLKLYNQVMRPIRHALLPSYVLGFVIRAVVFFGSARNGTWLAPMSFVLQIPHTFNVIFVFRYEYVLVLTRTFDFWFFAASVAIWFVCFSCAFQDSRVWALPSCCLDFINAFLVESLFRSPQVVLIAALSSIVFFIAVIVELLLDHIDDLKNVKLISSEHHALTTRDLLLNSTGTIMMLLCRLAYTTYNVVRLRQRGNPELRAQSNGYRCRIKLQPLQTKQNPGDEPQFDILGKMDQSIRLLSMQLAHQWTKPIDSAQTLVPWISARLLHPFLIWTMNIIGVIGLVSTLSVLSPMFAHSKKARSIAANVGLTCTVVFYVWFACHRQRQLLRQLVSSFYFLFLFVQISAAYLCACDMLYWDAASSRGFLSSWLWTQWVLMSDTICPVARDKIRFRSPSLPVTLLWIFEVVHLVIVCEVLVQNRWQLQDRTLQYQVAGNQIELRVVPFLFSRQITILVWSTRMLWRVWHRRESDELLLLQGRVEFDAPQDARQRRMAVVNNSVDPGPRGKILRSHAPFTK